MEIIQLASEFSILLTDPEAVSFCSAAMRAA
jgi:hypothetical protein